MGEKVSLIHILRYDEQKGPPVLARAAEHVRKISISITFPHILNTLKARWVRHYRDIKDPYHRKLNFSRYFERSLR